MNRRKDTIKEFLNKYQTLFGIWFLTVIASYAFKFIRGKYNNYLIYKYVYLHSSEGNTLYGEYPAEYGDMNQYGPFFSLVIAPFALLPDWLGVFLWLFSLMAFLFFAIKTIPVDKKHHIFIYWYCALEVLSALQMYQFNMAIVAILILSYVLIDKEKDTWAALFIAIGLFVKLYGIVGLCFFFFSKHKIRFILSFAGFCLLFFIAPMFISGWDYVVGEYVTWFNQLSNKNTANWFSLYQNVSLLGMVRKISGSVNYSDIWILIPGIILFFLPYFRLKQYKYKGFRLSLLASALLCVILFSTGTETSSYIIGFVGIAIWYIAIPRKQNKVDIFLLVFAFIISGLSSSDLFPRSLYVEFIRPYALKALPCTLIWLKIIYEMCTVDYSQLQTEKNI